MPETKPKLYFRPGKTDKRKKEKIVFKKKNALNLSKEKQIPNEKKVTKEKEKKKVPKKSPKRMPKKIFKKIPKKTSSIHNTNKQKPRKQESIKPVGENTDTGRPTSKKIPLPLGRGVGHNTLALQEFQPEPKKEIEEQKPFGSRHPQLKGNIKVKHSPAYSNERIPTGIPGLDEVIEGGLKNKSVTLAGGCAGAGKTIFGMQFILNGITQFNEHGVYISFEENKHQVYEDMARFGWDMQKLEQQGKFAFIQYTPEQVGKVLKTGGGIIRDVIDKIKAKRLIIDSISAFTLLHENELKKREASLALFDMLRKWGCTSIVVGQYAAAELPHESTAVEFEVDNIIWLYNIKKEDIRVRAIEVFKMRGTKHSAKIFPFEITDTGIVVYPEQSVF